MKFNKRHRFIRDEYRDTFESEAKLKAEKIRKLKQAAQISKRFGDGYFYFDGVRISIDGGGSSK